MIKYPGIQRKEAFVMENLSAIIEAILFVSGDPVRTDALAHAMNRLDSVWFADDLGGVLNEQHQFPIGSRYDAESLRAAHAVLSGKRVLKPEALYYQSLAASQPRSDAPLAVVGGFAFYG